MNNIESRVLEMKFDNEQFESAVSTTMNTLDNFKEKLKFDGDTKGLQNLGKATSNYQYTLQDVGESLSNLERRFGALGTIGGRVLERLTDSAYGFVTSGIHNFLNDIVQGGQSRAMNLEQAKFQLEGILGSAEKVNRVIYSDILPQLQGTPFSLDQAAVVMGQLAASGKTSSEQIQRATRGIAGLAAMTNHSFADVGRIFTKVAGNGVMMAEELNQLSGYGVNAASDLSKFFKIVEKDASKATPQTLEDMKAIKEAFGEFNEANIREAASKRMLHYGSMAAAMDVLYGEHAQKSTTMYTGALEDLKAALARVGAEPAAVKLEFLRDAFNALVPAVDAVNAVLKPFTSATKAIVKGKDGVKTYGKEFSGTLAQSVQKAGWAFQSLFVQLDKNHDIVRVTSKTYKKLGFEMKKLKNGSREFYETLEDGSKRVYDDKQALMNPQMLRVITSTTKSFVNVLAAFGKVIGAVGKGMKLAFPKLTLENVAKLAEHIEKFTESLQPSELALRRFTMIAHGAFTPIGLLVRGAIAAIRIFVGALKSLYNFSKPFLEVIAHVVTTFAQFVVNLGLAARHLGNAAINFGKFGIQVIKTVANMLHLNKVFSIFKNGFAGIGNIISDFFTNAGIKANVLAMKLEAFSETLNLDKIASKIAGVTAKVAEFFTEAFHLDELRQGFEEFWKPIKEFLDSHSLFDTIINALKNLVDWFGKLIGKDSLVDNLSTSLENLQTSIGGFTIKPAGKIRKWLGDFGKSIAEFLGNLDKAGYVSEWLRGNFKLLEYIYKLGGPLKKIWKPLASGIVDFTKSFTGIKSSGELFSTAGEWLKTGFQKIVDAVGIIINGNTGEKLQSSMSAIFNDTFAKNAAKVGKGFNIAVQPLSDALSNLGKSISSKFNKLDPQTVKKFLVTLVLLGVSFNYMATLRSARNTIKGFLIILDHIAEIPKAIGALARSFESMMNAFKAIAKAITGVAYILAIAASLVIFAAALKILSTIDTSALLNGTLVLAIAVVGIIVLLQAINALDFQSGGDKALKLSLSILGVAGAMMLLSLAIKTMVGAADESGWGDVWAAVAAISTLILVMGVLGRLVGNRAISKNIAALGWAAVGLGQGMKMMAEACTVFAKEMSPEEMDRALSAILEILVMFSVFAAANWHGNSIKGAAFSMIGIAIAIDLMTVALKSIGKNLDDSQVGRAVKAISTILAFFSLFALVVGIAAKLGAGAFTAMGMILSMALFVKVLAESMNMMAGLIDGGKLETVAEVIEEFLTIMALISGLGAIGGMNAAAGPLAIAALATALLGLAAAIYILGTADIGVVALGFFRLGTVLAGLIGAVIGASLAFEIFTKLISPKDALSVLAIAAAIGVFAVAIRLIAELPIESLKVAIGGLIGIMAAAGLVMLAFSNPAISTGLLLVGAAFALVGVAALFVGAGLMLVTLALSALIPLIVALGNSVSEEALNDGLNILLLTAEGLKEVFYHIADGVLYFGAAVAVAGVGLVLFAVGIAAVGIAVIVASVGILVLAGAFAVLASVLDAFVPQVKDSVLGTLGTLIGKVGEFFGSLREESGRLVKETEDMKNESAENAEESTKSAQEAFEEGTANLTETRKSLWDQSGVADAASDAGTNEANSLLDSLGTGISSNGPGVMSDSLTGIFGEGTFGPVESILTEEGTELPAVFGGAMTSNSDAARSGGEAIVTSAAEGANSASSNRAFSGAANKAASEYSKALTNSDKPKTAGKKMGKAAADESYDSKEWSSAGQDAAKGFASGMSSGTPIWVTSAARSMARAAVSAAKAELDVNSPSKVFIKIGHSVGEGFVMGIDAMSSNVKHTTEDLMDSSVGAARIAAAAINAATEIDDFNPVITPVVDLTKVDQSVNKMGSMFSTAFGVTTPFGAMNAGLAAQSFADSRNQNVRDDSIRKLASKIDSMTESMNSRSLNVYNTIEGSGDPEAFADGLIRSFKLNARTI